MSVRAAEAKRTDARAPRNRFAALVDKTAGNGDDMVRLIHKYVYTSRPYEKARGSILNGAMRINADAALNASSVQEQLDWFQAEKLVKDSITLDTLVDKSYVQVS